ncbi:hypothetical protein BGX31_000318 [Mortierella sp. GBA43]|nr:hypothetical protein BGX31_000318 [Mortierella sp. GBA43]
MDSSMETYFGLIRNTHDALIVFEGKYLIPSSLQLYWLLIRSRTWACRLGQLTRVHRRLSDIERQCVRSGSVYCFDEREAGMRRWTDGKSWSPSRVTGSFLTYRELDDSQGNHTGKNILRDKGLLKQSFSITTSDGQKLHLISYYTNDDVHTGRLLNTPSNDARFSHIAIPKGIYPDNLAVYAGPGPVAGTHGQRGPRFKSSSPGAMSTHTPPSNGHSPGWVSDEEPLVVMDEGMRTHGMVENMMPVMIPALRELPPLHHNGYDSRPKDRMGNSHEQDSLSVLANIATHPMMLPKLEPKEVSREKSRWVEDDRQLRALSSMLRL